MSGKEEPAAISPLSTRPRPAFAHSSEAEFAKILDFYEIDWQYEPRTFPLYRDPDGRLLLCFTPDFYLPEFDLYVELTTLRQKLVTKKNRKLRRLRELYPDVRIKLFYGKDIRSLLTKYGVTQSGEESDEPREAVHGEGERDSPK